MTSVVPGLLRQSLCTNALLSRKPAVISVAVRPGGWSSSLFAIFQHYALILETLGGSSVPPQPTWSADQAVPSWEYLGGQRYCCLPQADPQMSQQKTYLFVACLHSLCKEPHALRYQEVNGPDGGGGWEKRWGRIFFRFYISKCFGESYIPVSLPYASAELFLTCTLECRIANTISVKSHGKQTFWCGWYLFASCRQVDLIRTAFTTFAKHFETSWHVQQLPEPEWHSIPRLHLINAGDGLINDN